MNGNDYTKWPSKLQAIIQTQYSVVHSNEYRVPRLLKLHNTARGTLTPKIFEEFHTASYGMISSAGEGYRCACVERVRNKTNDTTTLFIRKSAFKHAVVRFVEDMVNEHDDENSTNYKTVFVTEPVIGFGTIFGSTIRMLTTPETHIDIKGSEGLMLYTNIKQDSETGLMFGVDKVLIGLEGIPRGSENLLHTRIIEAFINHFDELFTGDYMYQPGIVRINIELSEDLIKKFFKKHRLDYDWLKQMLKFNRPSMHSHHYQTDPSTLAYFVKFQDAAVELDADKAVDLSELTTPQKKKPGKEENSSRTDKFEMEVGMRIITAHSRANGLVPANTQGSVVKKNTTVTYITWDTEVLEEVIAQDTRSELAPIQATVFLDTETDKNMLAAATIANTDFLNINGWMNGMYNAGNDDEGEWTQQEDEANAEKFKLVTFNGAPVGRAALQLSPSAAAKIAEKRFSNAHKYTWGTQGLGTSVHAANKVVNTFGNNTVLSDKSDLKTNEKRNWIGRKGFNYMFGKQVPHSDFQFERSKWKVENVFDDESMNLSTQQNLPSSDPFFKDVDPRVMELIDDQFVVFKNVTPPIPDKVTPAEAQTVMQQQQQLPQFLKRAAPGFFGASKEMETEECEEELTESNKQRPEVYRFLNEACCTRRFNFEYVHPGKFGGRSAADSGCYNPATEDFLENGPQGSGIYDKATGQKLTKGVTIIKGVPQTQKEETRIVEAEKQEAAEETVRAQTEAVGGGLGGITNMASIIVSAALNLENTPFVGVRNDGRLISGPVLPQPHEWKQVKGMFTLVLKTALPLDSDYSYDNLGALHGRSQQELGVWIASVSPIAWPLIVPVPELAGEPQLLREILQTWPNAIAAHTDGFIYLKHSRMPDDTLSFNVKLLPKSADSGKKMFIKREHMKSASALKEAGTADMLSLLQHSPELSKFVFFPGVQMTDTFPFVKSEVEALCPYTTLAESVDTSKYIAFDSKGRQFKTLPSINDWPVPYGEKVLTGLFVLRSANVVARINEKKVVNAITAETILVSEAQPGADSLIAGVSTIRGVPIVHSDQLKPKSMASIHAVIHALNLSTKTQPDVAQAMFLSNLPEFSKEGGGGSANAGIDVVVGDEMDIMSKEMDTLKDIASKFKKYTSVPQKRLESEIKAVRGRVQRMQKVIQALTKTAKDHPMFSKVWINGLASQGSEIEKLREDIANIIELDLPQPIQSSVVLANCLEIDGSSGGGGGGGSGGISGGGTETLSDLISKTDAGGNASGPGGLNLEKIKEFRHILMALLVEYIYKDKMQKFNFAQFKLNGSELINIVDPEEENVFRTGMKASGVPRRGIQIVSANILKEGNAAACHLQAILFVINHENKSVAYLLNPAVVTVPHTTIDTFVQKSLQYVVRPQMGAVPRSCRTIAQADVFWPFLGLVLEIFNPDEAARLNASSNACMLLQKFVDEMLEISRRPGVDNSIRTAFVQIHTMQEKFTQCMSAPSSEQCRRFTWNLATLQKAQKEYAKGDYLTVYQMCSQVQHTNVSKQDVVDFFREVEQIANTSVVKSEAFTQTVCRRSRALAERNGVVKFEPAYALSVLN